MEGADECIMINIKRIFDVVASLLLGVFLVPVAVCIALAIKVNSPGPVLFRQKRLGVDGEVFLMNKFRKFPSDWGNKGPSVTLQNDSRMTKVGHFLERTKLDELPQLWNIFIGQMSFVGPRPESLSFAHLFVGEYKEVLQYKPGIFGPNQTAYRNESSMYPDGEDPVAYYERELFPAKARNDLAYFKKASLPGDVKWIAVGGLALVFNAIVWRKSSNTTLIMIAWDTLSVVSAWIVANYLKYSVVSPGAIKPHTATVFMYGVVVVPLVLVVVFFFARAYRHPVRYFSATDAYRLVGAGCAVWIFSAILFRLLLTSTSSMVIAAASVLSIILMCVPRFVYQQWFIHSENRASAKRCSKRVKIVVCGVNTQSVGLCSLLAEGFEQANLIGIISDDKDHLRREVHGVEVLGLWTDLDVLSARYQFDQVWLGTELAPEVQWELKHWCSKNTVELVSLQELQGFSSLVGKPAGKTTSFTDHPKAEVTDKSVGKQPVSELAV